MSGRPHSEVHRAPRFSGPCAPVPAAEVRGPCERVRPPGRGVQWPGTITR